MKRLVKDKSLGSIAQHPLRLQEDLSVDKKDYVILLMIKSNSKLGTLELSEQLKVAPKNLIKRLTKLEKMSYITKDKVARKPKGWQRVWKVTPQGEEMIEGFKSFLAMLDSTTWTHRGSHLGHPLSNWQQLPMNFRVTKSGLVAS